MALSVVGLPAKHIGANEIATGKARYAGDLTLPGLLFGKLLYTRVPVARIRRIDVSRAREMPGVVTVMTAADVPGENSYLYWLDDQPLFVEEFVRYQGDILAAVAAETEEEAEGALEAIRVDSEPMPGVFNALEAMKPDSPRVWPNKSNVHSHLVVEHGDIEVGFEEADLILDRVYSTQLVEHAFLETESAVAYVEADGVVVVYTSCQAPHRDRKQIARALGLPETKVRVITPYIGGAFGGKDEAHVQIHAALLAHASGRPVRLVRSREESILTHVKRHPVTVRYRTGAKKDGRLTAVHAVAIGDTGPYLNAGEEVLGFTCISLPGAYRVPHAKLEAYTVLTNNPICGAFRGFGAPQATFAVERQMDELAKELGIDPLDIRLMNGLETGDQLATGAVLRQGSGMKACLSKAADLAGWRGRGTTARSVEPYQRRGWGLACTMHAVGYGRSLEDHAGASIDMARDGSVVLSTGAADMGQGVHTILSQLAAERLGVPLDAVRVVKPDTEVTADAGASVASRQTFISGNAVVRAAQPIRQVLFDLAAKMSGLSRDVLTLQRGYVYADGERLSLAVSDLARRAHEENLSLHAFGYYAMEYPEVHPPDAYPYAPYVYCFGAHVAQVLVDMETGAVSVEDYVAVHDVGRAINPQSVQGQIKGGVTQGLGYALLEELVVKGGQTENLSMAGYLIPTARDVQAIRSCVVEIPEPYAPLGAKGVGEPPLNPVAPAIANAISDAIGTPADHLPLTPECILGMLESLKESNLPAS